MYISFVSGKGGTGKTIVSTSFALSIAKGNYFDLDVEEPNGYIFMKPEIEKIEDFNLPFPEINESICTFCKKCEEVCSYNAISIIPPIKKALVFDDLCHSCGACSYVCPVKDALVEVDKRIGEVRVGKSGDLRFIEGRLDIGQASGVPLISGIIKNYLNKEELNIIDSPPGSSCPVVESIKRSDFIIIVTEPTPFGLSDMSLIVDVVLDMKKKLGVIVNKASDDISELEDYLREKNIPILLKVPYRIEIQRNYSKGIPLIQTLPEFKEKFIELYEKLKNE